METLCLFFVAVEGRDPSGISSCCTTVPPTAQRVQRDLPNKAGEGGVHGQPQVAQALLQHGWLVGAA